MTRHAALVMFAALVAALLPALGPAVVLSSEAVYYLPVTAGTTVYVTQGNGGSFSHNANTYSEYAFDFGERGHSFPIAAARAGTVIGARSDSGQWCDGSMNGCWTWANYVVVDHGDGTSALYLHLAKNSALVSPGDRVAQGQQLGMAGNTGWTSGAIHLHFQVEVTPTPSTSAGWWWSQSVPVAFSDPSVRAVYPDGVPVASYSVPLTGQAPPASPSPTASPGVPPRPKTARTGWGEVWDGPYNGGGNWLWTDQFSLWPDEQCEFDGPYPCPITLLWRTTPQTTGYRIYVAPSTGTQWTCEPGCEASPQWHPVGALKCSVTQRKLLSEVDAGVLRTDVLVRQKWVDENWCVLLVAFNAAGESEPNSDYLILDAR